MRVARPHVLTVAVPYMTIKNSRHGISRHTAISEQFGAKDPALGLVISACKALARRYQAVP